MRILVSAKLFLSSRLLDRSERAARTRAGKIKYGLAAWLLGLPLPIIVIALLWGGCDW
jgi:hypothetical protein